MNHYRRSPLYSIRVRHSARTSIESNRAHSLALQWTNADADAQMIISYRAKLKSELGESSHCWTGRRKWSMADPNALKQFLTEEQIELERQRRQADWERVRSAQDPVGKRNPVLIFDGFPHRCWSLVAEAPAEVFDTRSLYEKLKVQHDAKKKEFEDMWAASKANWSMMMIRSISFVSPIENSIRGLDEDEATFLGRIDQAKVEKQRQLKQMEQEAIDELKISFFSARSYCSSNFFDFSLPCFPWLRSAQGTEGDGRSGGIGQSSSFSTRQASSRCTSGE